MRKSSPLIILALAGAAVLSGCGSLTSKDISLVGATFELTQPACLAEFSDGASVLYPAKCITVVRTGSLKKVELPAGTCLQLGEPQVLYPELNREVVYDVEVAGARATISQLDSPRRPWKGMVRGTCLPVKAPPLPLSLQ